MIAEILAHKREEVRELRAALPLAELQGRAREAGERYPVRSLIRALRRRETADRRGKEAVPALIAEVKRASPSRGLIRPDFDPARMARDYARGGASAISVLTDRRYFQGDPAYLKTCRQAAGLPVLGKDFLIDPHQVYLARSLGADAVLLIAGALPGPELGELYGLAGSVGLEALVEVHNEAELERALRLRAAAGAPPPVIGINNRDLGTFRVDLGVTRRLAPLVPPDRSLVSESGISRHEDLLLLGRLGVNAVLVGEALARRADLTAAVTELLGGVPGEVEEQPR